jgi:hypothetical protein
MEDIAGWSVSYQLATITAEQFAERTADRLAALNDAWSKFPASDAQYL